MIQEHAQAFKETLKDAKKVLVFTHVSPDGDALGSLTAMGQALHQMGIKTRLVCDDGVPKPFHFLPMSNNVEKREINPNRYDAIIVLDCGDGGRAGRSYGDIKTPSPPIINIDHHISNPLYGTVNIVDPVATSTTEILAKLFTELGLEMTRPMAISLLTGLVTDTLAFRIPAVTAETMQIAGQLMAAGANLSEITTRALVVKPIGTVQMWRLGLNNMHFEDGIAYTAFTWAQQQEISEDPPRHDGLNNILADIDEAKVGIVFTQKEDGRIKVGFRSRPPFDVSGVATALGGGGHKQAAGCTITGELDVMIQDVLGRIREAIKAQGLD